MAVKALYVSEEFTPRIAPALQELVGERVTEVLPALKTLFLRDLFLSGPVQDAFDQFVAARELAGHPVSVSRWRWKDDSDESLHDIEEEKDEPSYETDDG